jgi:putative Ca2+/H+ antiporter (TMEM165/GDT1 family)
LRGESDLDFTPLLTTFGIIALAEFGDKTQLTVIALSAGYDRVKVFTGVILAFTLVTALGVLIGDTLFKFVSPYLIKIFAGLLFVAFGAWTLISKENCETDETNATTLAGNPLISTFGMIALAEMGDKTQLSAITLVAKYDSPFLVFAGAVLALGFISLLGILAGKKLCEIVPLSKIRIGAGALFILFGILFLAGF